MEHFNLSGVEVGLEVLQLLVERIQLLIRHHVSQYSVFFHLKKMHPRNTGTIARVRLSKEIFLLMCEYQSLSGAKLIKICHICDIKT